MTVLQLNSVKDTTLWQRLHSGFSGGDGELAEKLAANLIDICREAYDRMRGFASVFPQYTLHDEVHLLRVTELMARVMPDSVADHLNPVEIALLILSAHFHDQGMALEREELKALDRDLEFSVFRDNWGIEHPNLSDVRHRMRDKSLSNAEQKRLSEVEHELQAALLTDFVRITHGERSATFVRANYTSDPRWVISGTHIAEFVARLSLSHVRLATDLIPTNGFRFDESIGTYRVNMPYLGLILRLADILDLDRDRTPDSLYRTINFKSGVSLREWEKHRSVDGWVIEPTLVQFTMRCEHPEYQRAAYQFMNLIDKELTDAQHMIRNSIPQVAHYTIDLPLAVDRSRIEPKDDAYIYHDLEFSLSRDEVVKLLMTNKLYGGPWLCVRELLQNSLDALRYRKALIKRDNATEWEHGKVEMQHEIDENGHEVIRCTDNGSGMDKHIIQRFLTNVGRSYYRSPEFEQERASFRAADVDFDPCAQFGIGFMSCFMLGDHVVVHTRRDYGPSRGKGDPLSVEINGLGGIVVIRKGKDDQPVGTTVEITGRRKPRFVDEFADQVKLLEVVKGYALACEFPIEANCELPEIKGAVVIPPTVAVPRTPLEDSTIKNYLTIEQKFSEIEPLINGTAKASFILDESKLVTLASSEASWTRPTEGIMTRVQLVTPDGAVVDSYYPLRDDQVCIDGILVAGPPGRERSAFRYTIGYSSAPFEMGRARFILDIRGAIKPPLTPARTLPDDRSILRSLGLRWSHISHLINKAHARLWEQVGAQLKEGLSPEVFWQLLIIYSQYELGVAWMTAGALWSLISVPIVKSDNTHEWRRISSLGTLQIMSAEGDDKPKQGSGKFQVFCADGGRIGLYGELSYWRESHEDELEQELAHLIASMSTVVIEEDKALLQVRPPSRGDFCPEEFLISGGSPVVLALPYSNEITDYFSVHLPSRSVNRAHPLVLEVLKARYLEEPSPLQVFAKTACHFLSNAKPLEVLSNAALPTTRWHKIVGSEYMDVDWQTVDSELHPPYKVRSADGAILQITGEDFERWAEAEDYEK